MPLAGKCPTYKTQVPWENNPYRPFCSDKCRLMDLGSWVEGDYRIPGPELEDERDPDVDGGSD